MRFWPKPRAAGVMATIWVGVTDTTVASTPLKVVALRPGAEEDLDRGLEAGAGDGDPGAAVVGARGAGVTAKTCGWPPPPPPTE